MVPFQQIYERPGGRAHANICKKNCNLFRNMLISTYLHQGRDHFQSGGASNSPGFYCFMCMAVHAICSFSASFSYVIFLFLILGIPFGLVEANNYRKKSKGARMRQKKRQFHELPYTEIVKSGTIWLWLQMGDQDVHFP